MGQILIYTAAVIVVLPIAVAVCAIVAIVGLLAFQVTANFMAGHWT